MRCRRTIRRTHVRAPYRRRSGPGDLRGCAVRPAGGGPGGRDASAVVTHSSPGVWNCRPGASRLAVCRRVLDRLGVRYSPRVRLQGLRLRLTRWLQARGWRRLSKLLNLKLPKWWRWTLLLLLTSDPSPQPGRRVGGALARSSRSRRSTSNTRSGARGLRAAPSHVRVVRGRAARAADARARRAPAPSALRVARRHRAGRVRRTAASDLVRRSDGADAAHPADGARAGRGRSLRSGAGVDGAARYLHTQFATFRSIRLAAAAYNAGRERSSAATSRRTARPRSTSIA